MSILALIAEPTSIERREGRRVVLIAAELDPAGPGASAVSGRSRRHLGARTCLTGSDGRWKARSMRYGRPAGPSRVPALLRVLTLLLVQYGSVLLARAGIITVPLSGTGAVVLLRVLGRPSGAMVRAGLLIAVGIVANKGSWYCRRASP